MTTMEPTVWKEVERTAQKEHSCVECRMPIKPGEKYYDVRAIYDDGPASFKNCKICHDEWLGLQLAYADDGHVFDVPIGELYQDSELDEMPPVVAAYWLEQGWKS